MLFKRKPKADGGLLVGATAEPREPSAAKQATPVLQGGSRLFESGGRTYAAALEWRPLLHGDPRTEIRQTARKLKAPYLVNWALQWDHSPVVGYWIGRAPRIKGGGVPSAAALFALSLPQDIQQGSAALLYRVDDAHFGVIGVGRGVPHVDAVRPAGEVEETLLAFTRAHPAVTLYIDQAVGDPQSFGQQLSIPAVRAFSGFSEAVPEARLTRPPASRQWGMLLILALALGVVGYLGSDLYGKFIAPSPQKDGPTPEELYTASLNAAMLQRSLVQARNTQQAWDQIKRLPAAPAGWRLAEVACKFVGTMMDCSQAFLRKRYVGTNETLAAAPLAQQPTFGIELDRSTAALAQSMEAMEQVHWQQASLLPPFKDLIVPVGARLQDAVDHGLAAAIGAPEIVGQLGQLPSGSPLVLRASQIDLKGTRDVFDYARQLPANTALDRLNVVIPEDETKDIEVQLQGSLYVH